jgi:hypothetical protein
MNATREAVVSTRPREHLPRFEGPDPERIHAPEIRGALERAKRLTAEERAAREEVRRLEDEVRAADRRDIDELAEWHAAGRPRKQPQPAHRHQAEEKLAAAERDLEARRVATDGAIRDVIDVLTAGGSGELATQRAAAAEEQAELERCVEALDQAWARVTERGRLIQWLEGWDERRSMTPDGARRGLRSFVSRRPKRELQAVEQIRELIWPRPALVHGGIADRVEGPLVLVEPGQASLAAATTSSEDDVRPRRRRRLTSRRRATGERPARRFRKAGAPARRLGRGWGSTGAAAPSRG